MGIIIYHVICTVLSCILLYMMLSLIRQHNVLNIMLLIFVCIANFGYTFLAVSRTIEEALLANKIVYIGCFIPFIMILSYAAFCKVKLPKPLVWGLVILNLVQLFFINSIGYIGIYYKDAKLGDYKGASYLIKTYGPGHSLYIMLLLLETLMSVAVLVYAFRKKKNATYHTTMFLGLGVVVSVLVFIIERRIGLPIDLLAAAYVIYGIIYLYISYRIQVYTISSGIISVYERRKNYVCLSIDNRFRLMDYNENSMELFPEIKDIRVDTDGYKKDGELYNTIIVWIKDMASKGLEEDEKIITINDLIYRTTIRKRVAGVRRYIGYVVEMIDDTDFQNNLIIMERTMADLDRARQSAIQASHAKSDFMANMSHEIRTPINAIVGMDEMIIRETKEPAIAEYAGYINEAGNQLLSLVNDILDFEKIEAGKLEISNEKYSLGRIIRGVYQMMHTRAANKNIEFVVKADPRLPDSLYGDENRIRQILINLISNGIKYTMSGCVTLSVSGFQSPPDKIELHFEVRDTGIGIREEDMEKIFDSFERVDSKRNRNVQGTGLGLAITRAVVEKMSGKISASSTYGKGSTFTVVLPQRVTDKKEMGSWQRTEVLKEDGVERLTINSPDMRVLAVDDMPLNLIVIEKFLAMSKLKLDTATNANDAIKLISENDYDVVLMDHFMPDKDGVEALQEIRAKGGKYETLPVIAITANAIAGSREEYLSLGFQDYISKPVDYNALIDILLRYSP
ncbi:MAG: response regulator [Lachnospiraceae bacterium]|nr:response regulator [Lachnospiraceae bacterium]